MTAFAAIVPFPLEFHFFIWHTISYYPFLPPVFTREIDVRLFLPRSVFLCVAWWPEVINLSPWRNQKHFSSLVDNQFVLIINAVIETL